MTRLHLTLLASVALLALLSSLRAEDAKSQSIGGVSNVVLKDKQITEVRITTQTSVIYYVVLDAKGKKLGEEGNGKTVTATGTVAERDGKKWLTLTKYEVLKDIQF